MMQHLPDLEVLEIISFIGLCILRHGRLLSLSLSEHSACGLSCPLKLGYGIGNRSRAPCNLGMKDFDHLAIQLEHALALVLGQFGGLDGLAREGDRFGIGRENRIARANLARMDERLAIKTHIAP